MSRPAHVPHALVQGPQTRAFFRDLVAGLSLPRKRIPSKYFYDDIGSHLFERICELEEYYLTRTELAIMGAHAGEMAGAFGRRCQLIEPGSGSAEKVRMLLERMESPASYVPIDVSREHLMASARQIAREFPRVEVVPMAADFTAACAPPPMGRFAERRGVYFPGSTIGNFGPKSRRRLLGCFADMAGPGGAALVGIDLRKDPAVIERAYNDTEGVTAAFNMNVLARANRELGADFDLSAFDHTAFYDAEQGRVEMHLRSMRDQRVSVGDWMFLIREGETIHTEDSYKFTVPGFAAEAERAGWRFERAWTDDRDWFAVVHLALPGGGGR